MGCGADSRQTQVSPISSESIAMLVVYCVCCSLPGGIRDTLELSRLVSRAGLKQEVAHETQGETER